VDNLTQASPATVSRCGMVYVDYRDLGWKPYIESWLGRQKREKVAKEVKNPIFGFISHNTNQLPIYDKLGRQYLKEEFFCSIEKTWISI